MDNRHVPDAVGRVYCSIAGGLVVGMELFGLNQIGGTRISVVEVDVEGGSGVVYIGQDEALICFIFGVDDVETNTDLLAVCYRLLELHLYCCARNRTILDGKPVEETDRCVEVQIVAHLVERRSCVDRSVVYHDVVVVSSTLVAVESSGGDEFEHEWGFLKRVRDACVGDKIVGRLPLIDVGGFRNLQVTVGRVGAGGKFSPAHEAGSNVSRILTHEAPVITASGYGGSGNGVGPCVVPDDELVVVGLSSRGCLDSFARRLYSEVTGIGVTTFYHGNGPYHSIAYIDQALLQFNIRICPFHALSVDQSYIADTGSRHLNRYQFHQ